MPQREVTIALDASQILALPRVLSRLARERPVVTDEDVFPADFIQEVSEAENLDDLFAMSPVLVDREAGPDRLTPDERALFDFYIRRRTRYSSWPDLETDAVGRWVARNFLIGHRPPRLSPGQNQQISDERRRRAERLAIDLAPARREFPESIEQATVASTPARLSALPHEPLFLGGDPRTIPWARLPEARKWKIEHLIEEVAKSREISRSVLEWIPADWEAFKPHYARWFDAIPKWYPLRVAKAPLDLSRVSDPEGVAWVLDLHAILHDPISETFHRARHTAPVESPTVDGRPVVVSTVFRGALEALAWQAAGTAVGTVVIGGIAAFSLPIAVAIGGGLIIYGVGMAAAARIEDGQTTVEIVGGSLLDLSGATDVWIGLTDTDIATGRKFYLSVDERDRALGTGIINVATLVISPLTIKPTRQFVSIQIKPGVIAASRAAARVANDVGHAAFRRLFKGGKNLAIYVNRIGEAFLVELSGSLDGKAYSNPFFVIAEIPQWIVDAHRRIKARDAKDAVKRLIREKLPDLTDRQIDDGIEVLESLREVDELQEPIIGRAPEASPEIHNVHPAGRRPERPAMGLLSPEQSSRLKRNYLRDNPGGNGDEFERVLRVAVARYPDDSSKVYECIAEFEYGAPRNRKAINTPMGRRIWDLFDEISDSVEVKSGRISVNREIRDEIAKDQLMMKQGYRIRWAIYDPVPSSLLNLLQRHGIPFDLKY